MSARLFSQSCVDISGFGGGGMSAYLWFFSCSRIGCVCQLGVVFVIYIALRAKWYVDKCCFHFFWSFRGKKPPCWEVQGVSWGSGGALHVC